MEEEDPRSGTEDVNVGVISSTRSRGGRFVASLGLAKGEGKLLSMPLLWLEWDGVGEGIAASSVCDEQCGMCDARCVSSWLSR